MNKMSNKLFAFYCLQLLMNNGKLDETAIKILTNKVECQRMFQCCGNFTTLNEVPFNCSDDVLANHCRDNTGRRHYYKGQLIICGRAFVVTNHWYDPNKSNPANRTPFLKWVKSKI